MPRYVDHDQRRREVTAAARSLVVERGRAALTVRNVADAVGCSTKVVSHYFTDMAELLHATYTAAAVRAGARLDAVAAADPGDVAGLLEALLPLDAERRADWAIWFAFWTEALTDERLRAVQRHRARTTTGRIADALRAAASSGRLPVASDVDADAHRLSALVQGIAAQATFDPRRWTPARQRATIGAELALIGHRAAPRSLRRA